MRTRVCYAGAPNGPATNVTGSDGGVVGMRRSFASGTKVYFNLTNDTGTVTWASPVA